MKILICETTGISGITHYTYNLCQALTVYAEVVLVTSVEYELENYGRNFLIRKVFKKEQNYFERIYSLCRAILVEKPDLIHFQSIFTARRDWLLFRVLRCLGFSIILTVHNVFPHEDFERNARGMIFSLKNIYSSCRALIVHCHKNKNELVDHFNIKQDRIFVIPHGNYLFFCDAEKQNKTEDRKKSREKLGLKQEDKVILYFGVIREYKGIEYLIAAFSKLHKEIPETRLIIAGHSWEFMAKKYEKLILDYQLENFVLYRPQYIPIEDMPLYFQSADLAVFPYLHTYGSGALHLAFAFSLPVVATDVGIFPETVDDGENGYLVPAKDADSLFKAMSKILSYPEEARRMGEYARHLAQTKYSWEKIAQQTKKIYESVK